MSCAAGSREAANRRLARRRRAALTSWSSRKWRCWIACWWEGRRRERTRGQIKSKAGHRPGRRPRRHRRACRDCVRRGGRPHRAGPSAGLPEAVDSELVGLYWRIGQYISAKLAAAVWGEGVVDHLAQHLACTIPGQRGFTRRNLFRMRQFYETCSVDKKVTALLIQLPWTHNLIILTQSKRPEEREFYLRMAV